MTSSQWANHEYQWWTTNVVTKVSVLCLIVWETNTQSTHKRTQQWAMRMLHESRVTAGNRIQHNGETLIKHKWVYMTNKRYWGIWRQVAAQSHSYCQAKGLIIIEVSLKSSEGQMHANRATQEESHRFGDAVTNSTLLKQERRIGILTYSHNLLTFLFLTGPPIWYQSTIQPL